MNYSFPIFVSIINFILKSFGTKLISSDYDNFHMYSALKRIHDHNIKINTIVDIGGSDGNWSRNAIKFFPQSSFIAIEPLIEREEALRNLENIYPNFSYELCAAGETNGDKVILNVADDLDGSTINGFGGSPRHVLAKAIDTIITERQMSGPFLLKFDTHGYEVPILKGASKTLNKTSVIIMEVYNFKITADSLRFHEMCSHMENLGFRCYDVAGPMLRKYDNSFWQMDLFFCRNDAEIFEYSQYR